MKNTDFRNFLDTVDNLVEGKAPRKTLKESPGDTYYVSKMKEKFIAMESDTNEEETSTSGSGEPEQELETPSTAEDAMSDAPESEETMNDEELATAISSVKTAIEASPEAKTAFEEILKHFGCESDACESEEGSETEESKHEGATSKWSFGSFMK